ncbi:uncharacterized protein C8Q71DRAFT_67561 [Rhodofomes roseus]|uniref:Uncharacterized protein n=1 Tax=Rhodofomes roseus TaxID=34475 RepID=A0ABQ8KEJ2_9APHY|nr:uncharacterized protein C8Q71DRAFT_67561 [Rhodofomes roseus]KAH9836127.1 hypothetical protein C8Q71DRAFT_67561 [Rhodofomes roseus]
MNVNRFRTRRSSHAHLAPLAPTTLRCILEAGCSQEPRLPQRLLTAVSVCTFLLKPERARIEPISVTLTRSCPPPISPVQAFIWLSPLFCSLSARLECDPWTSIQRTSFRHGTGRRARVGAQLLFGFAQDLPGVMQCSLHSHRNMLNEHKQST